MGPSKNLGTDFNLQPTGSHVASCATQGRCEPWRTTDPNVSTQRCWGCWGYSLVIEHLPGICKTLVWSPTLYKMLELNNIKRIKRSCYNILLYDKRRSRPKSETSWLTLNFLYFFEALSYTVLSYLLQKMLRIKCIRGGECLRNCQGQCEKKGW
jgi:hypothetical protein